MKQVCSSWSLDSGYRGEGTRFTCQCGAMTGIYPDHPSGEAQLDRHLDEQDERFADLLAEDQKRRWLPRWLRRRRTWRIV